MFQSLGRDSGCSSIQREGEHLVLRVRFNPSVGILGVQAHRQTTAAVFTEHVSIPRSGFWVFKHRPDRRPSDRQHRFNPSVGILGVQAMDAQAAEDADHRFNPSVGILGVQANERRRDPAPERSFNPSVGILGVQAGSDTSLGIDINLFQSLGRDSGCSSAVFLSQAACWLNVSIPRSGFWVFKLEAEGKRDGSRDGFNPSVGILGVQAGDTPTSPAFTRLFQSLGRDSGCSSRIVRPMTA